MLPTYVIILFYSRNLLLFFSVADYSDGGTQRAAAAPLNPVQKLNDMINHAPGPSHTQSLSSQKTPCTCGVFLSSQISKGSSKQPIGYAALVHEQDEPAACNALGVKACTNKCLEIVSIASNYNIIVKYYL